MLSSGTFNENFGSGIDMSFNKVAATLRNHQ